MNGTGKSSTFINNIMFLFSAPDTQAVERFIGDRDNDRFSYAEVGATADMPPPGYNVDHNRQLLGSGRDVFESAKQAIREWKMFDFPWIRLVSDETPIEAGRTVAIVAEHLGFYSMNASRIVFTIDEARSFRIRIRNIDRTRRDRRGAVFCRV